MADVEQTQKMVPLITCEISLCQYVFELVFGVNVFDLNLGSRLILSANPKNFYQVALVDRALQLHFSTLEKTRMDHNPVNSLILTFRRVSPLYRQEQVVQVHDVHTRSSPGLQKLKKTRTKAFFRSNSS